MSQATHSDEERWTPQTLLDFQVFAKATKARIRRVMRAALLVPMAIGLTAGLALLLVSILVLHEGFWHELTRDVGIAFLVSAWAVFGYELVQDLSNVEEQREHLAATARTMEDANSHLHSLADYQASGAIEEILSTRVEGGLAKPLVTLLRSSLQAAQRCHPNHHDGYAAFAQWYFEKTAESMAQLAAFRACESGRRDERPYLFSVPEPREVVARILGAEMHRLRVPPDSYDSVTNPLFYGSGRMHLFRIELEAAAARGVKTRRIFNLSGMERPTGVEREKVHRAKLIVTQHLKLANDYPSRYEVRFVGRLPFDEGWNHEYDFDKENPVNQHLVHAEQAYFGIFFHRSQPPAHATLAVSQDPKRLSRLDLRIVPIASPSALVFDELWHEWAIEENPFAGEQFDANKLKSRPTRNRDAAAVAGRA